VLSKCYWLGIVAVADAVACTVTVLFWLCCCSGVDASASPTAGAAEALNIVGSGAYLLVLLLMQLLLRCWRCFWYCTSCFPICKTTQFC
jgi:hypothetical protein